MITKLIINLSVNLEFIGRHGKNSFSSKYNSSTYVKINAKYKKKYNLRNLKYIVYRYL